MKRFLKIFGLSFAVVIVGLALLIGGAWLFGAFTEKPVKPKDIAFLEDVVETSTATSLRVTTKTEKVNQKKIDINVVPEGIIDCPKVVTLGEDFIVWPVKDDDGYNVGGIVTITASFEGMLIDNCIVKVDVPIADMIVTTERTSLSLGEQITFGAQMVPARALNPWKTDLMPDNPDLYDDREKTIYYFLCDDSGTLMDKEYAYFFSSGRQTNMLTSKQINANTRIVAQKDCNFFIKSFAFSTFAKEDYYNIDAAEKLVYTDGREQIKDEYLAILKPGRSPSGDDDGQFVTVTKVYIDSFTATEEQINTFLYETTYLTARKGETDADNSFNLDLKLHPAETSDGYSFTDLDSFIDNIILEYKSGAEVTINKIGQFTSGKPSDWKWTICPSNYNTELTSAVITAKISYYNLEESETELTLTHDFHVSVNTRGVAGIAADKFVDESGENKEYISLNSDSSDTNHIKLEEGMTTSLTDTGLLLHEYKYFRILPQLGSTYSTFSLMKFFLPDDAVLVPYKTGEYKVTFEFEGTRNMSPIFNFTDGSNSKGSMVFYKYNETTKEWELSPIGEKGLFRAEQIFDKKQEMPSGFTFRDAAAGNVDIEVKNVLYYESNSEYPFLEINGVKVKTFYNSDSRVITRQLAEITVEGFGEFYIVACVVVSDNNGSIIYNSEGNFEKIATKAVSVRVTNSVKDLVLNIVDPTGGTDGIDQGDFNKTVVVDENNEFYINIAPGPNTSLEVLTQAVMNENVIINYTVNGDAVDGDGIKINGDSLAINELEEDRDGEGNLIGYKFLLEVKNVYSVENARGESENIAFTLSIEVLGTAFKLNKTIEVRDHVIKEAVIAYAEETTNNKRIYASKVTEGVIEWKEYVRQQVIDLTQFSFTFESDYGVIDVEPEISFTANHSVITTGIISAVKREGKWILQLNNFPYYDDGVMIGIKMKYAGSNNDVNKRYVYDANDGYCTLRSYENSEAEYTLTVYGFNVTYNPKQKPVTGVQGSTVNILDAQYVEPVIKDGKKVAANTVDIRDIINFSMVSNEYFDFDSANTTITIKKSITATQTTTVSLMIGSNQFATHQLTFVSPFDVQQIKADPISAPNNSVNLKQYFTVKKGNTAIADDLIEYTIDGDTELSNGKTKADYVSIDGNTMIVKYVPENFNVKVFITVYEMNGDVRENKGTFENMSLDIVNDFYTNNSVSIVDTDDNSFYADGKDKYIDISSIYSEKDYEITMEFDGHMLDEDDPMTQFVYAGKKDANYGYSVYAYDIVSEDPVPVEITLHITITGRGDTYAKFTVYVKQYVRIDFARNTSIQSGAANGKDVGTLEAFSIKNYNNDDVSLGEGGIDMYLTISVAPDSVEYLRIQETEESKIVLANGGITEDVDAHIIVTRKIYTTSGDTYFYTIDYVLTIKVTAA